MNSDTIAKEIWEISLLSGQIPLLFVGENTHSLNNHILHLLYDWCETQGIGKHNIFVFPDNGEKIKMTPLREFISKSHTKSLEGVSIFFIENLERATLESFSLLLKFLEEPGEGNRVIVSSKTEMNLPETILSRLKIIQTKFFVFSQKSQFFQDLLEMWYQKRETQVFSYFFQEKNISKEDFLIFLDTFLEFGIKHTLSVDLVSSIVDAKQRIEKNNVLPKYETDILLLKLLYED